MLPRVETSFFKPLWPSVLHLLQQSVPDLYKALLQPACTFYKYNSVDDRVTYASVPKWTDASMFCRLPMNVIEMPLTYQFKLTSATNLRSWCPQIAATATRKLPGFSHSAQFPLTRCFVHEKTTISHRVQVQFSFGTIYNINQELSNNGRNLKAKFTVCALSFVLFSLSSGLGAKTT